MSYNPTPFQNLLNTIESDGLTKHERLIGSAQDRLVHLENGSEVLNLCANNYLGLANHPQMIQAATDALKTHGFGMASVRFICGTQDLHKELEQKLSSFLNTDDTILYSSCFDANGGLFETLLGPEDAVISDALNHASIIDGVRLCKAKRFRYANADMKDLEERLIEAKDAKNKLIVTDGVFSMDGTIAPLDQICDLADKYDAMVMVDDSHAVGFIGTNGAGTPALFNVQNRVDIVTGTLGKALGGASGGYTSGRSEIIQLLRQKSRPYLFSNSVAPPIVAASLTALKLVSESSSLRDHLQHLTQKFRDGMTQAGFTIPKSNHPICPIMLGDARLATAISERLLTKHNIYVVGFSYPVVPKEQARIRVQLSAAHTEADIDHAVKAFSESYKYLKAN